MVATTSPTVTPLKDPALKPNYQEAAPEPEAATGLACDTDAQKRCDAQYDEKAAMYDSFRFDAPGWGVLSPILDEIKGKRVLDMGCGTGAFLEKLIDKEPSTLDGSDTSEKMIVKAQERVDKIKAAGGSLVPKVWAGDTSKVADGAYDVVICLQVLQNLTDVVEECVDLRVGFCKEINRILAPGGLAVITTRYRKQPGTDPICEGPDASTYGDLYWYADKTVVPKAVNYMEFAVPADPVGELTAAGFTDCAYHNSPDTVTRSDAYPVGANVLNPAFRAGDSFFSRVVACDELPALEAHITSLQESGKLDEYIATRREHAGALGQVGCLVGRKA